MGNKQIKGFDLLIKAIRTLDRSWWDQTELITFGRLQLEANELRSRQRHLGFLHDRVSLVIAYSAADVLIVPSLQEAFGQIASEAMACGTRVVAFRATGLKDIVDHQQNGYSAEPFEAEDLADGVRGVLESEERHQMLAQNAHKKAVQEFDHEIQAQRYLALYQDILN